MTTGYEVRENRVPLKGWLAEHNARILRQEHLSPDPEERDGETVTWYAVGNRVLIVHRYAHGHGYETYLPASDTNRLQDEIDALNRWAQS